MKEPSLKPTVGKWYTVEDLLESFPFHTTKRRAKLMMNFVKSPIKTLLLISSASLPVYAAQPIITPDAPSVYRLLNNDQKPIKSRLDKIWPE